MKNFVALLSLLIVQTAWSQAPDTILINGKILTVDQQFSTQEAIAVRDGKILAAGTQTDSINGDTEFALALLEHLRIWIGLDWIWTTDPAPIQSNKITGLNRALNRINNNNNIK